jgi:signal transduction histidine kinase
MPGNRSSYPRDIALISIIFIILIVFLAAVNLYISVQLRNEYIASQTSKLLALADLSMVYMRSPDSNQLLKNLASAFGLERLVIMDAQGDPQYDSRAIAGYSIIPSEKNILGTFRKLPGPGAFTRQGDHFLCQDADTGDFFYLQSSAAFSLVDRVFNWHLLYVTVSLVFVSVLGFLLIRNLLLPMRYIAGVASRFGIEMEKEDFVPATFNEIFSKIKLKEKELVEFSAYIAHEFRNSLAAISGLARLVEKGRKPAADILKECADMDELITSLIEYSRPIKLQRSGIPLTTLIDDAVTKVPVPDRIVLQKAFDEKLEVNGDHELLVGALSNVLRNSVESIEGKGKIEVAASMDGGILQISIADTGCGIDKTKQELIFSPFYSGKEEGTGLGLAFAKKVVELHDGRIEVTSEKGKGTIFVLKFPQQ